MTIRIGINGFGRIGRGFLRAALGDGTFNENFEVVAINDIANVKTLAHLLRYDSVFGMYKGKVDINEVGLVVDEKNIEVISERDPSSLPWNRLNVDYVIESTGLFTKRQDAEKHLHAGAKKVIISAPSKDPDITLVLGVNQENYDSKKHNIVSMASCTTNCLAPVVKIINDKYGIENGFLTTCHASTNDQKVLDLAHADLRRARSANQSIIPTTTGAASALGKVVPEVEGKMDGISLRVPVSDGSINDIVLHLKTDSTISELNDTLKEASKTKLKGIMGYTEEPIVSSDIIGNPHSAVIDSLSTNVIGERGKLVKIMAWYDNEWGFSNRLVDLTKYMSNN